MLLARIGLYSVRRIVLVSRMISLRAPMGMESMLASWVATIDLDVLRSCTRELSRVSYKVHRVVYLLIRRSGANTGSGKCYYKYSSGTYYSNSSVYASGNLISNGTPNKPVGPCSMEANIRLTSFSVLITIKRHTPIRTAISIKYTAVSIWVEGR